MNHNPEELPHSFDMELELLGILLLKDGKAIPDVAAILNPDDFFDLDHQLIYKIILRLFHNNITPNMLSIIEELRSSNKLNRRLTELTINLGEVAFSTAYAIPYSQKLKEMSTRRKFFFFSRRLATISLDPTFNLHDLWDITQSYLHDINSSAEPPKAIHRHEYVAHFFSDEREIAKKYSLRKTGFPNIDEHQIFSPGLYVLGATPACGKTTFAWQLLEQLASFDEHCIFCSYEMSRLELFSKSFARELFIRDNQSTLTSADIRKGASSNSLFNIASDFIKPQNDVEILQLRDESVDDLLRLLLPHCNDKDKSPVVCIDYLQIIPPSDDKNLTTDKAKIDDIVHKLKSFQRDTNTTFIIISSFNRLNYYQQVSFECFKESGNIEYSADVVWALQLNISNFIKEGTGISYTRNLFDDAKKRQPRDIHFKCLKNRQGNNYDVFFHYFSAHDFFSPCNEKDLFNPFDKASIASNAKNQNSLKK